LKFAQKNFPETVSNLNPGLSEAEILSITQKWGIQIPHEISELYQWRNGCGDGSYSCYFCIFEIWGFLPLEKVILQKQPNSGENEVWFNINYPLNTLELFFGLEGYLVGYLVFDEKGETKWVELGEESDGFFDRKFYYTSLNNMLLTFTESKEKDPNDNHFRGFFTNPEYNYNYIWRKYNSDELSVAALKQLYQPPNFQLINQLIRDLSIFHDPRKHNHLAQLLETIKSKTDDKNIREITTKILSNAKKDNLGNIYPSNSLFKEYWRRQNSKLSMFRRNLLPIPRDNEIRMLLQNPEENTKRGVAFLLFLLKAVDSLIELTTHHEAGWRRESAWALGQMGDIRAKESILNLIEDEDIYVREAARLALRKLI